MCALYGSQAGENQDAGGRPEIGVFDRNPDPALDELTELAAVMCGADFAYIGWMDYNRLWFKSRFGFRGVEQSRSSTACQWMIDSGVSMLIANAGEDGRFPQEGIALPGCE